MKVLQINHSDISGGAAISGYRLHQGLLAQNIDSRLLVSFIKTSDDRITAIPRNARIDKLLLQITRELGLEYINFVGAFDISRDSSYVEANIIHFHNLHSGYFNYLAIPSLTATKPAVLTLHDMWSFTGHCAYSFDCDRWKTGCGKCPYPDTYPEIKRDNTHLEWKLKSWVYNHSNLSIVSPSNWLMEQAQQSILKKFPIHFIPHGIDTEAYQPLDKQQCRSLLGISPGKKVLMFGAARLNDSRKGTDLLIKALASLPESLKAETILLTVGDSGEAIARTLGMQVLNLGYISGDRLKCIAYSAADLFVFPTRADIFGLVLQESMACGTPVVSFKVGGVPDLVRPGITGYLAAPEDTNDFCNGIVQLLEDEAVRNLMSQNCREITLTEYSLELQAQRYIELYRQVVKKYDHLQERLHMFKQ